MATTFDQAANELITSTMEDIRKQEELRDSGACNADVRYNGELAEGLVNQIVTLKKLNTLLKAEKASYLKLDAEREEWIVKGLKVALERRWEYINHKYPDYDYIQVTSVDGTFSTAAGRVVYLDENVRVIAVQDK
jgi:hypothetical protein